jgi:hypothetical protein
VVDFELSGVVFADGRGVLLVGLVHGLDGLDHFLGADDKTQKRAGGASGLPQADEVLVGRFDGLAHFLFGFNDADACGLQASIAL